VTLDFGTTADADDIGQLRAALRKLVRTGVDDRSVGAQVEWRARWRELAELGITGLCLPRGCGGSGFEVGAAVAVARELGAALHPGPFAGITAGGLALASIDEPEAQALVADLLTGERICAFGSLDASGRFASAVDGAPDADAVVLLERSSDELLFVSDPPMPVTPDPASFDMTRSCGMVTVGPVDGARIGRGATARLLFGLLLAADALGCLEQMLARTVDYAGQRQAFGRAIGGFQAVQHRLVDHAVQLRGMSLAVEDAARQLRANPAEAARSVALAEISVSARAVHILHDLLQLTGAIGFTWEYGLHFYERRAHQDARLVGNPRAAVRAIADLEGWSGDGRR
jgi:alkylation response protein AidB-like acyl-CoA dehydrogenase